MAGRIVSGGVSGYPIASDNPFSQAVLEVSSNPDSGYVGVSALDLQGGILSRIAADDQSGSVSGYALGRIASGATTSIPANTTVYLRVRATPHAPSSSIDGHSYRILLHRLVWETASGSAFVVSAPLGDNSIPFSEAFGRYVGYLSTKPLLSTPTTIGPTLSVGDQHIFAVTVTPSPSASSLRVSKIVLQLSGNIGEGANALTIADSATSSFMTASGGSVGGFRLFIGGSDATSQLGIRYTPVRSGAKLYLIIESTTPITVDSAGTLLTVHGMVSSVVSGNGIAVSMPRLATQRIVDTNVDTILPSPTSNAYTPTASLVWSDGTGGTPAYTNESLLGDSTSPLVSTESIGR